MALCVVAGCGGNTADRASTADASDTADATTASDSAYNQLSVDAFGLAVIDATDGTPSVSLASDGGYGNVAVELDSGAFPYCYPPAGASSDVCGVCGALDAGVLTGTVCDIEWLRCGNPGESCDCVGGTWTCPPLCPCR
jgi:hypothetical protein